MRQRLITCLRTILLLVLCGTSLLEVASSATGASAPSVTVQTESGAVQGVHFGNGAQNWMFLGIPYAAAPTGARRWTPPEPPQRWTGVRPGATFGASCPQRETWAASSAAFYATRPGLEYYAGFHTSEDCLFVNVWTTNVGGTPPLPVVVWFHGGGNVAGTGETPLAPALTARGVVLASFNYRLGTLGFMAHPALTAQSPHRASGNYGLMDQIAAVSWVRRNISAFGGDPAHITVMGGSSGANDICRLMTSPQAQGLFQQAILQSGGCPEYLGPELRRRTTFDGRTDSAEAAGVRLAHRLGIDDGTDALVRLRQKTVDDILAATNPKEFGSIGNADLVDGYVIPEQPARAFAAGRQAAIPVLLGSNADESSQWSADEAPTSIPAYRKALLAHFGRDWKTVLDLYPARRDGDVVAAWEAMDTDFEVGVSMFALAQAQRRIKQSAHLYFFTYPSKGIHPGRAYHGLEMLFLTAVFGGPTDATDDQLADVMGAYWTQFAKTGDPNATGLPAWPRFDPVSAQVQELGAHVHAIGQPRLDRYTVLLKLWAKRLAAAQTPGH